MDPNVIYSTLEIKQMCRICLKMSPNKSSIWDAVSVNDIGNIQFVKMIMECTSVIVEKDDGFPEYICSECSQQLTISYCFKRRCEKSNANLEQIFEILKASGASCDYILIANSSKLSNEKVKNDILIKSQENDLEINETIIQRGDELIDEKVILKIENLNEVDEYCLDTNDAEDVTLDTTVDIKPESNEDVPRNVIKNKSKLNNCASLDNSSSALVCPYCLKQLKNKRNLTLHKYVCKKATFNCDQCLKNFPSQSLLSIHLSTSHREILTLLYICDICNDNFNDKSSLIEHFYIHIETSLHINYDFDDKCETYICYSCDKMFSSMKPFVKHGSEHSQNKDYRCRKCDKAFEGYDLLKKHIIDAYGILPYFCGKCFLSFENINKVNVHCMSQHHSPMLKDTFKCSLCEKIFKNLFQLKSHLKHHKADLYKCLVCFKSCNSIVEFNNHKTDHNVSKLCPICGKQFPRTLRSHIQVHHKKVKQFTCDVCNKTYRSLTGLTSHKRIHTNERPYVCTYCPYRARQPTDLTVHIRRHTGEKPYVCTFPNCGQRFKTSSHRNVHYLQHTGERNHECQICKMNFVKASDVRRHMLIHSDKREHKCDICDKEFRRKHHLTVHKFSVHGISKDKCNKI